MRFLRWLLIHVGFALFPLIATYTVYHYFLDKPEQYRMNPGEVLFFTFMISAIAFGEVIELLYGVGWSIGLGLLSATFLAGIAYSLLLYGMSIYQGILIQEKRVDSEVHLLALAKGLALGFFLLGTLVQVVFKKMESRIWGRRYH